MGITMLTTCRTIAPAALAAATEARGFESLWIPEHSHIPTSRDTPFPGAAPGREELPDVYWHLNDQMVAMSMAAAVTTDLVLGSAVTLLAQHDPIWLAKQVATLDHLSGGRVELGVGFGWNREELESHGIDYPSRRDRTREIVGAMRSLWNDDVASFEGEHVELPPSWAYPKPTRHVPLVLGGGLGPKLLDHLFDWADGWMPIRSPAGDFAGDLATMRRKAEEAGRDPATIAITVMNAPKTPEELHELGALGVDRVAFTIWSQDPDEAMAELDAFAELKARTEGTA